MSTPPLSTNAIPLPLSLVESPTSIAHTPTTLAFQSALPHLLQPLSPELSALHAARIRLLLELPVGSSRGWSCTNCGWLKDEFGWKVVKVKPEKGKKVVKTPDVPVKKGRGRGKRGNDEEADLQADISMPDQSSSTHTDSVFHSSALQSTTQSIPHPPPRPSKIGQGARKPSCKPVPRNRQKSTCPLCGSAISLRPPSAATKAEFPSTRRTRAIVDANGGDVSVLPLANGIGLGDGRRSSLRVGKLGGVDSGDDKMELESTGIALIVPPPNEPSSRPSTTSGKTIISDPIKSSPKLAYIPLTDPDPATESLPSLTPSALPPPSGDRPAGMRNAVGYVNLGPVGGTGKAGKGKAGKKTSSLKTSTVAQAVSPPSGAEENRSVKSASARTTSSPKVKKTTEKTTLTPNVKDTAVNPITTTTEKNLTANPTVPAANPTLPPATAPARGPPPKKKQKTGLAKLLADSKAREQESEKKRGTGLLSLGGDWEL